MNNQLNLLTVDLEEWFSVEALSERFTFEKWPDLSSTIVRNSRRLLDLFDRKGVRATWFVLGWCAEKNPGLIRDICQAGHEIACHSYRHRRVNTLTPDSFREDTVRALDTIEKAAGVRPTGYRAPSWSIDPSVAWAFEILAELGFDYDSSIFPIKHDLYGMPTGPRQLFEMTFENKRRLVEVPASTYRLLGQNLPVGGGGYLRHSPYWYTSRIVKRLNGMGQPVVVYVHPWELDPDTPQVEGLSLIQRFRTYGSTSTLSAKLSQLLDEFEFTCMADYISFATQNKIGFERR